MLRRMSVTPGSPPVCVSPHSIPVGALKNFFVEYGPNDHHLPDLHAAAKEGNVEKLRTLLARKAQINETTVEFRFTPLHAAALSGSTQAAEYLLECGANPDARELHGGTPLMVAATFGHTQLIKLLLSKSATRTATATTIFGQYKVPLDSNFAPYATDPNLPASMREATKLIWTKDAIVKMSHPCLREISDTTPLHCAAAGGHLKAIDAFLEAGMEINALCSIGTPLHAAATNNKSAAAVKFLLSKGADPTAGAASGIATPLHWAAYAGDLASAKTLLAAGCKLSAKASKYCDSTPLHWAAVNGNSDTINFLISKGADINARCSDGSTPLHWGSCFINLAYPAVALDFIHAKADIHATANDGSTALHWAAYNGSDVSLTFLMINGLDKMTATSDGYNTVDLNDAAIKQFADPKSKRANIEEGRFRPPFW